jgi:putative flippase GtrA
VGEEKPSNRLLLLRQDEVEVTFRAQIFRFLRASEVGLAGFAVLFCGTAALVELARWSEPAAYALMLFLVSFYTFWVQQRFVFKNRDFMAKLPGRLIRFAGTLFFFRGAEFAVFWVLVHPAGLHYTIAATVTNLISFVFKFMTFDKWVFRTSLEEPTEG